MADHVIESMKYLMTSCLTALAQMSMGQVLLRVLDRTLWIVEKSAQWSLPCHESPIEENGKSFHSMELVRPLPWVLFLPWLILLRLSRLTWNLGGVILGYPTIDPSDIVRYVQKTRRRLRTIKTNGIKTLRQKRIANNRPLSTTPDEKSATESTIVDQKRKYTQISSDDQESDESEEETLNSKIERLARENSFDDRDFQPGDSSETSESSQTDLEDEEKIISQHEVEGLLQENNALLDEYKLRSSNAILKTNSVKDTQTKADAN
uniref:LeuA_1 protein n=1 Tax=Fopius arisanus TaxID=64838 RepID=A0A0C9Q7G7_9HYME